ncbi:MAG: nodulation protein NfeD [Dehalococcoidales bacterium]|nr:nodulation protein NfeD [Dehalococcoidales bacterium]
MIKIVFKAFRLAFFISLLAGVLVSGGVRAATPTIEVLHVDGTIVPIVADYINRGLNQAEAKGSTVVIIQLSTPGGVLSTTQEIVERILNAKVPVVVYVSPAGGWAGSAGTFITIAAHIAAMAPGSRIGAATPVAMGEGMTEEMKRKVTEDAAAWIRSIAEMRGRDPDHAELAVREGKSYTDGEALKHNLIDLRADSLQGLISQLNGMKVTLVTGEEITLNTEGYMLDKTEMSIVERFLHAISNPNIAYILLSLGTIGIIAEIYNPGALFPGITGGICLLLAFYSLGVLDAYWGGILLILLAFGLFIAEVFTTTFGLFTAGGITALVLGSLILFPGGSSTFQIDWRLIATTVIIITALFTFVIHRAIQAHRRQPSAGKEELIGKTAVVKVALEPEGVVFLQGERWTAISEKGRVEPGEEVIITKVNGLKLWVTKKQ